MAFLSKREDAYQEADRLKLAGLRAALRNVPRSSPVFPD